MFKSIIKEIPNGLTCLNLFLGCMAILSSIELNFEAAFYYTILAGLADFLDGTTARILQASSPIGKDLDSLADVISFGLAPSLSLYFFFKEIPGLCNDWFPYLSFLIVIYSAIRLAKFNNDPNQSENFIGLPVPANAIFWSSLLYLINKENLQENTIIQSFNEPIILILGIVYMSNLLTSKLSLFSLKFKSFSWKKNQNRYIFLLGIPILFLSFKEIALPLIIQWYIVWGSTEKLLFNKK